MVFINAPVWLGRYCFHRAFSACQIARPSNMTGVVALALLSACSPRASESTPVTSAASTAVFPTVCTASRSDPVKLVDLPGFRAIRAGGLAVDGTTVIAAGSFVTLTDAAEVQDSKAEPFLHHELSGAIELPARTGDHPTMNDPVPVQTVNRLTLIWGESQPTTSIPRSKLPPRYNTEIWSAERSNNRWSEPRRVAQGNLSIEWSYGTTVAPQRDGTVAIMTVAETHVGKLKILFGTTQGVLDSIPIPDRSIPYAASFIADGDSVLLVAQFYSDVPTAQKKLAFVTMVSGNSGRTWSQPREIAVTPRTAYDLRIIRDRTGTYHIIWRDGSTNMNHLYSSNDVWLRSELPNQTDSRHLLRGFPGIDACGTLAIARQALRPGEQPRLALQRWRNKTWIADARFEDAPAFSLVHGVSPAGEWFIGWSGVPPTAQGSVSQGQSIWILTP